ncbi:MULTISPECIES: DNA repair protein RecN [Pontibacillus]|uniref:DNA repair protein RecN n=1 Tax=Pontibacillus chungwhensis TaxID=265426 RepID=A0ABY8UWT9_9BACI|nr:DNA repair protein RecN [Pontibacillus chungwhensis]MCD5323506.1 DNA repair protein RecN [Pontibacillus sp. HN14]WIF96880.1 DNA repair protein RecN [Pontibacillus chungwhensis]
MLAELSIKDFAIIDEVSIQFREGLTVLTGETGAGKSIIIDAIQLLTGGRGSAEFVRYGTKKAEIEGLFFLDHDRHQAYSKAELFGVDIAEDGMLVLNRTISANGKSICRVNGKLVTLAILREFGQTLIDIHTQHETQSLMDVDRHIELLDLFDREQIGQAKLDYLELYKEFDALKKRYKELSENEQEMAQRLDLLEFQYNELDQANLKPGEDDELGEQRNRLMNHEKIYKGLNDGYNALYGEQKALDWLSLALSSLENARAYDDEIAKKAEELANHYYMVEELAHGVRNQLDGLEFSEEELDSIESRLNEINRLKKKYGQSVNDMLEYAATVEEEIDQIKNKDTHVSKLEQSIQEKAEDIALEAKQLHEVREQAASALTDAIQEELKDLHLEKAAFGVDFSSSEGSAQDPVIDGKPVKIGQNGYDLVKFMITTNPGEPLKDIHKVASGGELSRIMLALKRIFSKHQGVTSVIFDEVDTGVSGRVAQAIAEKIHGISSSSQVLCISHLPQVAAMADTHLYIRKEVENDRTKTIVEELDVSNKVEELSRMISGAEMTETTKDHATELLDLAEKFKKQHV